MVINVHAGHNPSNMIACGASGYLNESDQARIIKDVVISQLRAMGHTVYDCTCNNGTSQNDVLAKIVAMCNSHSVDLDVSIHLNAGGGRGTEVWVYPNGGAESYAQATCDNIAALGFRNRGVKTTTNLYVLNKTRAKAMLVECCFVDSEEDYNLFDAQAIGIAIAEGITGQSAPVTPEPAPAPQPAPTPAPSSSIPDVYYSVRANKILPEVRNDSDYAGLPNQQIKDLAVRLTSGTVYYRVHVLNGGWLPWVTGCDWNDANNGYAGNGRAIDCIQIKTGSDVPANIEYRVAAIGRGYYPWVTEDSDYAGVYGKAIDKIQIKF